jgi:hypothetical protein
MLNPPIHIVVEHKVTLTGVVTDRMLARSRPHSSARFR